MSVTRVQPSLLFKNKVQGTYLLVPTLVLMSLPDVPVLAHVPDSYNLGIAWENGEISLVPLSKLMS